MSDHPQYQEWMTNLGDHLYNFRVFKKPLGRFFQQPTVTLLNISDIEVMEADDVIVEIIMASGCMHTRNLAKRT